MVPPTQFIPIAENSTLILDIGQWILEAGCQQLAAWSLHEKTKILTLALNISASQFQQADFVEQVKLVIEKYNIEPSRLKLELTESVALDDIDLVAEKMHMLRDALGVQLSLDDFGTGYSSLSYFKRLPIDQVKIDQSFVQHMVSDAGDAVMVKTIIDLAHNFDLDVIAEGVETEDHWTCLQQYGCKSFQGYLFSKPLPLEGFEALLNDKSLNDVHQPVLNFINA
jgi:EAL domain-containing protein (putative c-di-GMP-specific phosphodiesterase class I)